MQKVDRTKEWVVCDSCIDLMGSRCLNIGNDFQGPTWQWKIDDCDDSSRDSTLRVCVATALTTPCQWSLWYPKWTLLWWIYYQVPNWLCVQLRGISMNVEERNIYCLPLRVIYVMTGHHSWTYKNNIKSKYNTFSWCIDEQEMKNKYPFHLESYRQREINLSPLKD